MNFLENKKIIISQYRDEDGLYVAKVDVNALESKGETYEQRLDDAIHLYRSVVESGRTYELSTVKH